MSLKVVNRTLPSGLKVVVEENPYASSVAYGYFVKTGARDEIKNESGVSHFLEHMLFKGNDEYSALELSKAMARLGVQANAWTSEEATVYYGSVIPESGPAYLKLLTSMMRPSLNQEDFDMEKKVILEEIALYEDRPSFCLFERAQGEFFDGHGVGNSVLGSKESIQALSREMMLDYFNRRYSAANITFVACGEVEAERVIDEVGELTANWPSLSVGREYPDFTHKPKNQTFHKANLNQSHLTLFTPGCSNTDERRYALQVLTDIVGDSQGSKIYWKLVHSGLCEEAYIASDERDRIGVVYAYLATAASKLEEARSKLYEILKEPLEFSTDELLCAKAKLGARILLSGEVPLSRAMGLGIDMLTRGEVIPLPVIREKVERVGRQEIEELLHEITLRDWSEFRLVAN
jgi:predicted Zn-dependent peptidase